METTLTADELQKIEDANIAGATAYLSKVAQKLKNEGLDVKTEVLFGNVIDQLTDFTEKQSVDLIIIATHGRSGVSRWVWGSVADRVLRSARVPVLMVRPVSCLPDLR
jgi:nucleotide-binding universal stress UspA family protein